jgi:DNA gyrase inhibitor GyrI
VNLTQKPDTVIWPETFYVYVEKLGPFQETARQAWTEIRALVPKIAENNEIKTFMSLYKVESNKMTYRAGVSLKAAPKNLPAGVEFMKFAGGNYTCFISKGSYANLPQVSGEVFRIVAEKKLPRRPDYCIENYANNPDTTPEAELITEILIPTL